jgi:DHA3 family macrolide efflux protein-like MFS transporter
VPEEEAAYSPPENGFRTFVSLWVSQAFSVFGSQLSSFAVAVWLTTGLYPNPDQKGLLAAALSMMTLAFGLPSVLLAPFAGILADRVDRKTIMFWTNVGLGLVSAALAAVLAAGALELWSLVAAMILYSSLQCFHSSAFDASYAMLVPENQLPRANGMMQTIFSLSGILSPAAAAALIGLPALLRKAPDPGLIARLVARVPEGAVLAIAMDALSFLVAAIWLLYLNIPSPRMAGTPALKPAGLWTDVKEGMAFIGRRRGLMWLLATFAVVNLCSAPFDVLRPMIVRDSLAADYTRLGLSYEGVLALMSSAGAIGGLVGGFIITAWGGLRRKRVYGVLVSLVLSGIAQAVFGLSKVLYLSIGSIVLTMFALPAANSHSQTIWQTLTPREMQGRVFAVRRVVAQFTSPVGAALSGVLGAFDPGLSVSICGAIALAFTIGQFFNRKVTTVEDDSIDGAHPERAAVAL